jgi:hypothetical protein
VRLAQEQRLLPQLLRLLPRRLLAVLDDWSYRVARSRAERRRRLNR